MQIHFFSNSFLQPRFIQLYLLYLLCGQIHTTSQSSPTQAYTQAINDLDKELEYLKLAFEVCFWLKLSITFAVICCMSWISKEQKWEEQFTLICTI